MLPALHTKFAKSLACASIFASLFLIAGTATAQFTRGSLVVERMGTGSAALSSASAQVYLMQFATTGGAPTYTVAIPATGTPSLTAAGSSTAEGILGTSAERDVLILPGYSAAAGVSAISSTTASANPRELFKIFPNGSYSLAATTNTFGGAARGGTSSQGSNYFLATSGNGVIAFPGANTPVQVETTTTNSRGAVVYNGQLYITSGSANQELIKVGTGVPTVSATSCTTVTPTGGGDPGTISFSPDGSKLYIADGTGGISKFVNSSGTYTLAYTFSVSATSALISGRGIAVDYSTPNAKIYAVDASTLSNIIAFTDAGVASVGVTTLATSPTNTLYKGIQWAPATYASVAVSGAASVCSGGTSSFLITGNPNAAIHYNINSGSTVAATLGNNGLLTVSTGAISSAATLNLVDITSANSLLTSLSGSATVNITAPPAPTLSPATAAINTGSPQILTFGGASGDVITYTWTGGGPATTTIGAGGTSTVSVTPPLAGTYTYSITSATSASGCTNSAPTGSVTSVLTVTDVPFANFIGSGTNACNGVPASIAITGNGGGTVTYGDGTTPGLTVVLSGSGGTGTATLTPTLSTGVVTYTLTSVQPLGAGSPTSVSGSFAVTVNPTPTSINGNLAVCVGASTTLTDGFSGTWSSVNGSGSVTIGSGSGSVAGVSAGTATIVFTSTAGCTTSSLETVNALPSAGSISGASSVCLGSTISLSDATGSGVWSSTTPGNGSVDVSGNVTGVVAGTTTISYTVTDVNGCMASATQVETVNPAANAGTVTGPSVVAGTSSITLSDAVAGGTWSSSNTSAATVVGSTGVVTAVAPGTTTISYTVTNCGTATATYNVTVRATYFTHGNLVVEQVQAGGTSAASPVVLIEYAPVASASVVSTLSIPSSVSGSELTVSGTAAAEGFMTLSAEMDRLVLDGYDTAATTASVASTIAPRNVATVDGYGNILFPAETRVFGANNMRGATASGTNYFGVAKTNGVVDMNNGTLLSSSNVNNNLIEIFGGNVYISSAKTGTGFEGISQMGSVGTSTVTGQTETLVAADGSSANGPQGFAVSPDGHTMYVADGTNGTLKYTRAGTTGAFTLASGGYTAGAVNATPVAGIAVNFSAPGGAMIYATTFTYTNIIGFQDAGATTTTITTVAATTAATPFKGLMFAPSCFASATATTASLCGSGNSSVVITGNPTGVVSYNVNGGSTQTITLDATGSNTVTLTGITVTTTVNLLSISTTACSSAPLSGSAIVSVNPIPAPTLSPATASLGTGTSQVLTFTGNSGDVITYQWSSGGVPTSTTVTIGAGGTATVSVLPPSAGSYTYQVTSATSAFSCTNSSPTGSITSVLSVSDVPFANFIGSGENACIGLPASIVIQANGGGSVVYGDGTSTYTVTASGSGGIGTATITATLPLGVTTYTLTSVQPIGAASPSAVSGSFAVTVNPIPDAISGSLNVCVGGTATVTDDISGTWSTTDISFATVVSGTGVVTGVSAGTANITFTSAAGCKTTAVETVNAGPAVSPISGTGAICATASLLLTDGTSGGAWSTASSNVTVGTDGTVTGVNAGTTATVSYTVTGGMGCQTSVTAIVTVNPAANAGTITGRTQVVRTESIALSDAISGGTWSSSNTSAATVVGSTGVVTGIAAGTTIISYTVVNCGTATATYNVTVKATYFTPGNLIVEQPQGNSSAATPVVLIEYAPTASASIVSTLSIPATTSGSQLTVSGSAAAEGFMTLSAEMDRLVLDGYDVTGGVASVAATTNPRNVATVDALGNILFPAETNAFGANNMRGATASGTNYFGVAKTVGVVDMNNGTTLSSSDVNNHIIQIFNGNVYVSSASGSFMGISQMGSVGTSTVTGQTETLLAADASANGTEEFAISPDGHTLYAASGTSGTLKFTRAGTTGAFTLASGGYTSGAVNAVPVAGLAVNFSAPGGPMIYATNFTYTNIIGFQDAGSTTTTITTVATTTAAAPFKGLMFAPSCFANVTPLTAGVCNGSNGAVIFTGNPTGTVSYNIGGGSTMTAVLDATGSATVSTGAVTAPTTVNLLSISTIACSSAPVSGSATVTVNPAPVAQTVTGGGQYCPAAAGAPVGLSGSESGASYSLYNGATLVTTIAGTGSAISFGLQPTGTYSAVGTYTATGCSGNMTGAVSTSPYSLPTATIAGSTSICSGASATISVAGGTPFASIALNPSGSFTLDVSGNGSTTVNPLVSTTYTATVTSSAGCATPASGSVVITVNPTSVTSINGNLSVCGMGTTTLTDATTGSTSSTWTSGNTAIATVGATTGIVTGVAYGSAPITYTIVNSCGTYTTAMTVSVNPTPLAPVVTPGELSFCSSTAAQLATATGVITGTIVDSTGYITALMVYSVQATSTLNVAGIPAGATITSVRATVNAAGTSTGNSKQYNMGFNLKAPDNSIISLSNGQGSSTLLPGFNFVTWGSDGSTANPGTGGATPYVSGNDYIANLATSVPSGFAAGNKSTINNWAGLNTMPNGNWTLYAGSTYNNATSIDTFHGWSITITYTMSPTSVTWAPFTGLNGGSYAGASTTTVNVLPATSTVYTVTASVGSCSSSSTLVATASPSSTLYVPAVSGASAVCVGATKTLTDLASGGTWSSSSPTVGSVNAATGVVTGLTTGTTTIVYTLSNGSGCSGTSSSIVTVNAPTAPGAISGSTSICTSSPTTLSDSPSGGVWSSSNTAFVTIGSSSGIATAAGTNLGTSTITYTYTDVNGCISTVTTNVTVVATPTPITVSPAFTSICPAANSVFLTATGGAVRGPAVATTGNILSTIGTTSLSATTFPVTISNVPAGATIDSVTVTINDLTAPYVGDWVINLKGPNPTTNILNLSNLGGTHGAGSFTNLVVSSVGTASITATTTTGDVMAMAASGVGPASYLSNTTSWTSLLNSGSPNGTWTLIAYLNDGTFSSASYFTGFSVNVYYSVPYSGAVWSPAANLYTNSGATTGYDGVSATNTIYALNPSTATNGTYNFAATSTNGACASVGTSTVVLNSTLAVPAITGTASVCQGLTTTLSDPATGGTWSTTDGTATVVSSTGVVTGVSAGTATISYNLTVGGCSGYNTQVVTINPLPVISPIGGNTNVCLGTPNTLSDGTTAGTFAWSSSNTAIATIGSSSGTVTGVSTGTSTITYSYNNGTCGSYVTTNINVSSIPGAVTMSPASASICPSGPPTLLSAAATATATATFSSGPISVSVSTVTPVPNTINVSGIPAGAVVTGVSMKLNATVGFDGDAEFNLEAPNDSIINIFSTGSSNSVVNFVNTTFTSALTPGGGSIIPNSSGPAGWPGTYAATAALNNAISLSYSAPYAENTQSWSSLENGNPNGPWQLIGLDDYHTDVFTITSWSLTLTYSFPVPITWAAATGLYTDAAGMTGYAGSNTDTVYAMGTSTVIGTVTVYTATATNNGCVSSNTATTTSSTTLSVAAISGAGSFCSGVPTALSDANFGGTWSSDNTGVANVGSTSGIVTGGTSGTANIIYTLTSGSCSGSTSKAVTVNALPAVGPITGNANLCFITSYIGSDPTSALSDATASGAWSSSNPSVATIGSTGTLTGLYPGSSTISYTYSNGTCSNTATVNAVISASALPLFIAPSPARVCASGPAALLTATGGDIPMVASFTNNTGLPVPAGTQGAYSVAVSIPAGATITDMSVTLSMNRTITADDNNMIIDLQSPNTNILNLINARGPGTALNFVNTTISSEGSTAMTSSTNFSTPATFAADEVVGVGLTPQSNTNRWSDLYSTPFNGTWNLLGYYNNTGGTANISSWTLTIYYTVPSSSVTWSSLTGLFTNSGASSAYTGGSTSTVYSLPASTSTYTVTSANGACPATANVTVSVNALPTIGSTGGGVAICSGAPLTLSGTGGVSYSWTGGVTNGVPFTPAVGVNSYTVTGTNSNGCTNTATTMVAVYALPTVGTTGGGIAVCDGTMATLSGTGATSYSWTGGITDGVAFTPSLGVNSYTVTGTDGHTCMNTAVTTITVNAIPTVGTTGGGVAVCNGTMATLSGTGATSYSWTGGITDGVSFTPSLGVNSYTVTGTTLGCSNTATTTITVNAIPTVGTTGGGIAVCDGTMATLSGTGATSYSWTGGITDGVAFTPAVGVNSYTVTGTTLGCSNTATTTITVNAIPTVGITGGGIAICDGTMATLSGTGAASYSWTGGITDGVSFTPSLGVSSYTVTGTTLGCSNTATTTITVNAIPTVGTTGGGIAVCNGTMATLSGTGAASYSWTGGITDGVAFTPAVGAHSYTVTGTTLGCSNTATTTITVNAIPTVGITGGGVAICDGTMATLSGTGAASYSWTGGITDGVSFTPSLGVSSYTVTGTTLGCSNTATTAITVNAIPTVGTTGGGIAVCSGTMATLNGTGATTYMWTGGITDGVAFTPAVGAHSYTVTGTTLGCSNTATTTITVNAIPTVGTTGGGIAICNGTMATLSGTGAASYSWTGGITDGVSFTPSLGVNSYTVTGTTLGCSNTAITTITVNPLPLSISGATGVCVGSTSTLSDLTPGGNWSSNAVGTVSVVATTGVLRGNAVGTAVISYTLGTSCASTIIITVNPIPTAILGTKVVCVGAMTSLSDAVAGGAWSSSNTNGSIDASGNVTGVSSGTSTITYAFAGECKSTATLTVNPIPAVITGASGVCVGLTTTLSDATTGGTWASSNTSVASIGSTTRVVTGLTAGNTTITYRLATGCINTYNMTVNPLTAAAVTSGTAVACVGSTITLTDATTGGAWSSSAVGTASVVATTGVVAGVAAGTAVITYLLPTGCKSTVTVTINAIPTISGSSSVCTGSTAALTASPAGGVWVSSTPANGSISTTGVVAGIAAGTTTISYTLTTGCAAGRVETVNPISNVSGAAVICSGTSIVLTDATTGGAWSSSSAHATVGTDGTVTGVSAGTSVITYLMPTGCKATNAIVTVNTTPTISGTLTLCANTTVTLTGAPTGGAWVSSAPAIGSISSTGVVTGVSGGTTTISYTLSTGCATGAVVAVNPILPVTGGNVAVCSGASVSLTDATPGGSWSSSNAHAIVGTDGTVTGGTTAGTAVITYLLPTGCKATTGITTNALPAVISGLGNLCLGSTSTLSDATAGGTWSSSVLSVATIGSSGSTTTFTTVGAGTTTIGYTLSTGCAVTKTITVDAIPSSISNVTVCAGSSTTLSDVPTGGTWTSSNVSIVTIGAATGVLTGVNGGTATITYADAGGSCFATATVTVTSIAAISGNLNVCSGGSTTLVDGTSGGIWTSSGNVSVIGTSGVVTGGSIGTGVVTYTIPSGCARTVTVNVNPAPSAVSGTTSVCIGGMTTLSDDGSGTWTSSNTLIATVTTSGTVTGAGVGTATITYVAGPGCIATVIFTVTPGPSGISGASSVCQGAVITLSDLTAGGSWSASSGVTVADGGTTATITGNTVGTSTVTYMLPTGCSSTYIVTVKAIPTAILGMTTACLGTNTILSDATTPAVSWTSSNTLVATVNAAGVVVPVNTGTTTIIYTATNTCTTTTVVSINALPSGITGSASVCPGSTVGLTDLVSGGTWSSASPAVASVDAVSGVVTGIAGGTASIKYSVYGAGCAVSSTVTVSPAAAVTGAAAICQFATVTLHDATSGGTWSTASSNATVGSTSGVVAGTNAGTATITYTTGIGCTATAVVTINAAPASISGAMQICVGSTVTLTDATSGGNWTSLSTNVTVDGSGDVTGGSVGTASITYALSSGCQAIAVVTVNAVPSAITGTATVCAGMTTSLTDGVIGGTWTSTSGATVGATGIVTGGPSAGTATISYTTGAGCAASVVVTVNAAPDAISGSTVACAGSTIALSDDISGGVWSSSNSNASVDGSGNVMATAGASGTVTISYVLSDGCYAASIVTVAALPSAIMGNTSICIGGTTTLSDIPAGGVWSTTSSAASIGSASGIVNGLGAGTATITYSVGSGCATTVVVNVYGAPPAINGILAVCVGGTAILSDDLSGGTWITGNTGVATVGNTSGIVSGVMAGTTTISYTVSGCSATGILTVNSLPPNITGPAVVCPGATVALTDASAGGTWSTMSTNITLDGSGNVTGGTAGAATVTYTALTGCTRTYNITVNSAPTSIMGNTTVCQGSTTILSDATTPTVSWTSSNTTVATISASGAALGVSPGSATIIYTASNTCTTTTTLTVTGATSPITGNAPVCPASPITLTDATGSGTWISGNTAIATVGSTTGTVAGVATGTAIITYSLPGAGCSVTTAVTVNAAPNAGTLLGALTACLGTGATFSDATSGGTWSSTNLAVGTINVYGTVTTLSTGTTTVSYTVSNVCGSAAATATLTVNPLPSAGTITGNTGAICAGAVLALTDAVTGGAWSSSNTAVGSVDASGNVTGVAGGIASITYAVTTGCGTARTMTSVTVNAFTAGVINGSSSVTAGLTDQLTDGVAGGVWSASNSNATISATGLVTGVTAGADLISYTITNGCGSITATYNVTVTGSGISPITGIPSVCQGSTTALTDATPGGTWHSSNTLVATVGTSGIVTAAATGTVSATATISYTVGGVPVMVVVTVNPNPSGIVGSTSLCAGTTITLSDLVAGGAWTASSDVTLTPGSAATVTGFSSATVGTSTVTYALTTGCAKTLSVTVKALPTPILGNLSICGVGNGTSLSDMTTATSWASSAVGTATVNAAGHVYGVSPGTATIIFTASNTCTTTATVTVYAAVTVATISGTSSVGHGLTITLSDATGGGTWSSSNAALGSVDASGDVTGVGTSGTVTISYSVSYGGGCMATATKPITVHTPAPPAHGTTVGGTIMMVAGTAVSLDDEAAGGIWSSSNTNVVTVDGGLLTAIAPGAANITHTVTNGNGEVSTSVTPVVVNSMPMDVRVVPNPNNGAFTVKGMMGTTQDVEVTLEVTDVLGQVIYNNKVIAQDGKINEAISLSGTLANGMYMMNVHTATEQKVFHFVIEK